MFDERVFDEKSCIVVKVPFTRIKNEMPAQFKSRNTFSFDKAL